MSFSCMERSLWRFWREGPGCVFFCAGFGIVSLWQGCDLHRQKMFDQGCISMYLARRASYSIPFWKFASLCEYVHWKLILNLMLLGPITQTQKSVNYFLFYLRTSGQVTLCVLSCCKWCLWSFLQKKGNPKERVNVTANLHTLCITDPLKGCMIYPYYIGYLGPYINSVLFFLKFCIFRFKL